MRRTRTVRAAGSGSISAAYDRYGRPGSAATPAGTTPATPSEESTPANDQVELERRERGREDPRRGHRARAGECRIGHVDASVRAHRQGLAHRLGGVRRGHRQERDLALAGGLDELERLLEDVFVVAVDDRRAVGAIEPAVGQESLAAGRRVRDGFGQDDDAHAGPDLRFAAWSRGRQLPLPSSARAMTSRWICCVPS